MLTPVGPPNPLWRPASARVENWRRTLDTWFVDESSPDEVGTYQLAKFVITFSYVVKDNTYSGKFTAGSPRDIGETFEILYDPEKPEVNTGSDKKMSPWMRAAAWIGGVATVILLMKLFPDAGW